MEKRPLSRGEEGVRFGDQLWWEERKMAPGQRGSGFGVLGGCLKQLLVATWPRYQAEVRPLNKERAQPCPGELGLPVGGRPGRPLRP